jgi:hypothetical protein
MTANITNQDRVELKHGSDASEALAINATASSKVESAGKTQKNGTSRESFLSAVLRAFSSVAF